VAVLQSLSVDLNELMKTVEKSVSSSGGMMTLGQMLPFTPRAKKVLEAAAQETRNTSHKYIGTEHLLLALLSDKESSSANALAAVSVDYEKAKAEIERILKGGGALPGRRAYRSDKGFFTFVAWQRLHPAASDHLAFDKK
jgi:ATP-dependent Clp protease ATP-binding subunit ClpC